MSPRPAAIACFKRKGLIIPITPCCVLSRARAALAE